MCGIGELLKLGQGKSPVASFWGSNSLSRMMECAGMRESTSRNQANGSTPHRLQEAMKLHFQVKTTGDRNVLSPLASVPFSPFRCARIDAAQQRS